MTNSLNQITLAPSISRNRRVVVGAAIGSLGSNGLIANEAAVIVQSPTTSTVRYFKESTTAYMNIGETAEFAPDLYANPELKVPGAQISAAIVDELHANPELKALVYSAVTATSNLHTNPELKVLEYMDGAGEVSGLHTNPELKSLSYAPTK